MNMFWPPIETPSDARGSPNGKELAAQNGSGTGLVAGL